MHDGEIVEDKVLKHTEDIELKQFEPRKMKLSTLMKIAIRNLLSTPKRLIFMLLMQIIAAVVFVSVYSSLIAGIRETGLSQSSRFPTVPETRLLVEKRDGSEFTNDDLNALAKMRHVDHVYKYAQNFYNTAHLMIYIDGSKDDFYHRPYYVRSTDTAARLSKNDVEGRIPTAKNEIVFSSYYSDIQIGDKVTIGLTDYDVYYYAYEKEYLIEIGTFTVVGIDKLNRSTVYFSEEYLNQIPQNVANIDFKAFQGNISQMLYNMEITDQYDNTYKFGGPDWVDSDLYIPHFTDGILQTNLDITIKTTTEYGKEIELHFENIRYMGPKLEDLINPYAYIGLELYELIIDEFRERTLDNYILEDQHLVSISVGGFYAGSKILKNIDSDKYRVYYPSYIFEPMRELLVFLQTLLAILVLSLIGMLLGFIIQIVTKNIMRSRQKDFAIYRSIGANKYILARLVVFEQILLSIIAFMFTLIALIILKTYVYNISKTILYIQFIDYIIILAILILLGMRIGLKFNRKVFNQSVIETLSESRED